MMIRRSADAVIAEYGSCGAVLPDHRMFFAGILVQVKRDINYKGKNPVIMEEKEDAREWLAHGGDTTGITFAMCCEALKLREADALRFMATPYKEQRIWNGLNAKCAEIIRLSDRTSSRARSRSFRRRRKTASVSFAASPPSSFTPPMRICLTA